MTPRNTWTLRVGADTDLGRQRQRNEDSFCVLLPGDDLRPDIAAVVAVADGMGGHEAGDVASAYVVEAVRKAFRPGGDLTGVESDLAAALASLLRQTNVGLHAAAEERGAVRGMGSTATLAAVEADQLIVAHVGDSRLYQFRSGLLEQITEDHSWTAEQRRRGLISEEEEAIHPRRNLLTECIGVDREINVFSATLTLAVGDRYLLCSDGLHGPVPDDQIADALGHPDPERAAALLVERANLAGGPDNVTAVVLEITGVVTGSEPARAVDPPGPIGRTEAPEPDQVPTAPPKPLPASREDAAGARGRAAGPASPSRRWAAVGLLLGVLGLGTWGILSRPWSRDETRPSNRDGGQNKTPTSSPFGGAGSAREGAPGVILSPASADSADTTESLDDSSNFD